MKKKEDLAAQGVNPLHHSNGQGECQLLSSAVIHLCYAGGVKARRHLRAQSPCVKIPSGMLFLKTNIA